MRRLTQEDARNLFELDSDPEVVRYANPAGRTSSYERIRDEILPRFLSYYGRYEGLGYWAAEERPSGVFLGWFHLRPRDGDVLVAELGYRLRRSAWGKGYATEGSRALVRKAFTELEVERIVAEALKLNAVSIRVMEKAGLRFESTFMYPMYPGRELEAVRYVIDREKFQSGSYST